MSTELVLKLETNKLDKLFEGYDVTDEQRANSRFLAPAEGLDVAYTSLSDKKIVTKNEENFVRMQVRKICIKLGEILLDSLIRMDMRRIATIKNEPEEAVAEFLLEYASRGDSGQRMIDKYLEKNLNLSPFESLELVEFAATLKYSKSVKNKDVRQIVFDLVTFPKRFAQHRMLAKVFIESSRKLLGVKTIDNTPTPSFDEAVRIDENGVAIPLAPKKKKASTAFLKKSSAQPGGASNSASNSLASNFVGGASNSGSNTAGDTSNVRRTTDTSNNTSNATTPVPACWQQQQQQLKENKVSEKSVLDYIDLTTSTGTDPSIAKMSGAVDRRNACLEFYKSIENGVIEIDNTTGVSVVLKFPKLLDKKLVAEIMHRFRTLSDGLKQGFIKSFNDFADGVKEVVATKMAFQIRIPMDSSLTFRTPGNGFCCFLAHLQYCTYYKNQDWSEWADPKKTGVPFDYHYTFSGKFALELQAELEHWKDIRDNKPIPRGQSQFKRSGVDPIIAKLEAAINFVTDPENIKSEKFYGLAPCTSSSSSSSTETFLNWGGNFDQALLFVDKANIPIIVFADESNNIAVLENFYPRSTFTKQDNESAETSSLSMREMKSLFDIAQHLPFAIVRSKTHYFGIAMPEMFSQVCIQLVDRLAARMVQRLAVTDFPFEADLIEQITGGKKRKSDEVDLVSPMKKKVTRPMMIDSSGLQRKFLISADDLQQLQEMLAKQRLTFISATSGDVKAAKNFEELDSSIAELISTKMVVQDVGDARNEEENNMLAEE